jgi:hypothetical protein
MQTVEIPNLSLREKPFKSVDHIRNAFDDILKRPFCRFPWHRRILQRYIDGHLRVHLHGVLLFRNNRVGVCWECGSTKILNDDCDSTRISASENWKSMLVTVYEQAEQPERVIPSAVRLNTFNFVDGRCGDLVPLKSITMLSEVLLPEDNREGNPILSSRRTDQGSADVFGRKFPCDVIESTAQVAKNVANDSAEVGSRVSGDVPTWNDESGHMNIVIDSESVRLRLLVSPELVFERVQVFLCPDDFEPRSV